MRDIGIFMERNVNISKFIGLIENLAIRIITEDC